VAGVFGKDDEARKRDQHPVESCAEVAAIHCPIVSDEGPQAVVYLSRLDSQSDIISPSDRLCLS
jgi:hypothetical protein